MARRLLPLLLFLAACGTAIHAPLRNDDPEAAASYYAAKRAGTADVHASLATARDAMRQMPRYSTVTDGFAERRVHRLDSQGLASDAVFAPWHHLGPGNIGGRTRTLIVDPANPKVMYAGGVSGGIWKTETGGLRWKPIGDDLANIAVNSLVMHPTDPLTLYAGTGEGYFREEVRGTGLPLRGNGIFATHDGGATWTVLASTSGPDFHWVNDLVISRRDPSRLYAATRTGVWRSADGGTTWTRVHASSEKGGCLELAYRFDQPGDFLFASCGTLSQATVYRTKAAESDTAWEAVLPQPDMARTSLAIAPSNPSIVYALAASNQAGTFNQGLLAVYRSTANGDPGTWEPRVTNQSTDVLSTTLLTNAYTMKNAGCGSSQNVTMGWYCNTIAVDPVDPERVWVGGVDLFRSDDGGARFGLASYWWGGPSFMHADQHAIVFHPQYDGVNNRTIYFANDGGIYRTGDALAAVATAPGSACQQNASSMRFEPLNHSFGVTQFYHGAVMPDGRSFIGGTQDNGTLIGNAGVPDGWKTVLGGDGAYVAVDPTDANYLYAQTQYGNVYRSTNGGTVFYPARSGLSDQFLFITPMQIDPNQPKRLWIGGRRMWRSDERGTGWKWASTTLPGQVSAIAVAPGLSDRVLAGTNEGSIARTDGATMASGTTAWSVVRPRDGWVSSIAFDPFDANVAYATYAGFGGNHVWRSADGGTSWTAIDNGLPDLPVHSIAVDPTRRTRLYLGTDLGVFVSLDGGATWAVENTGFANAVTEHVVVGQGSLGPAVYAFTHGRGAWRAELVVRTGRRRGARH